MAASAPSSVCFMLLFYWFVVSGMVYNVVIGPKTIGHFVDPSGKERILPMRLGGANLDNQYVLEGLSAGLFIAIGSMGILLLTVSNLRSRIPSPLHFSLLGLPCVT